MPRKEPRNYDAEYKEYHGKQKQIDRRNDRNKSVRSLNRTGKASKDGMEVHHKNGNTAQKGKNLAVIKKATNRKIGNPNK